VSDLEVDALTNVVAKLRIEVLTMSYEIYYLLTTSYEINI
jgi:hypothetical protein